MSQLILLLSELACFAALVLLLSKLACFATCELTSFAAL